MVPSFKNTALIFLEISFIQFYKMCTKLIDSLTFLFYKFGIQHDRVEAGGSC